MKYASIALALSATLTSQAWAQLPAAPDGFTVVASPMPEPDGKAYAFDGMVDKIVDKRTVVVRFSAGEFPLVLQQQVYPQMTGTDYFMVTADKLPAHFRIGYGVRVVGRYASNAQYRTVAGVEKSMPVISLEASEAWKKSYNNIGVPK